MFRPRVPTVRNHDVDLVVTSQAYACHQWMTNRFASPTTTADITRLHVMRATIAGLFHPTLRHVISGIEAGQDDGRIISDLLASHGLVTGDPVYVVLPRYLTVVHADLVREYFRGLTRTLDKRHVGIDAERRLVDLAMTEGWCGWH